MRSPFQPLTAPSPLPTVYTPAVLQGELPPWAHPTPSPSPMIRCPEPDTQSFGTGPGTPVVTPIVPEVIWEVCMPFIQQMCVALQQAMEIELQERVDKVLKKHQSPAENVKEVPYQRRAAPGGSSASPPLPDRACPFNSLLGGGTPNGQTAGPGSRRLLGRRAAPFEETLQEENSSGEEDAVQKDEESEEVPHKVTFGPSSKAMSTGGSSKGTSPNLQGPEPPVPIDGASAASGPMYLARPQSGGGRLTPVASPLVPTTEPPWQLSEVALSGGGANIGATGMDVVMEGDAATDGGDPEKSVMVCRHWKSKGWCRMEDKCKFLHPDHKRGSGARKGASARDTSPRPDDEENGNGEVEVDAGTSVKTGSSKSRRSRTSRRKAAAAAAEGIPPTARENGDGPNAVAAAPAAPGLVRGGKAPGAPPHAVRQGLPLSSPATGAT